MSCKQDGTETPEAYQHDQQWLLVNYVYALECNDDYGLGRVGFCVEGIAMSPRKPGANG